MLNGIIIVNKEKGFTSHDVVAKLRGICGQRKIGHTGTLDPEATGVLPVCLGSATKLCDMLTDRDKEYVADLRLGVTTDTQDMTGEVLEERPVTVTEMSVREVCASFVGAYAQVPPMYSAIKINGKKLYELAREGREVERAARTVQIHELEIIAIQLPVVTIRVSCSKGTYIRTLCSDIGEKLGCGGCMESLQRTRAGEFELGQSMTLDEIQKSKDRGELERIVRPVDSVFENCPALHVAGEFRKLLDNGNAIKPCQTAEKLIYSPDAWVKMYTDEGSFAGVYSYEESKKYYKPVKMFLERE